MIGKNEKNNLKFWYWLNSKILEFNQYQKYDKAPFIIYTDLESWIEKIDGCKSNPWRIIYNKIK